jgi:phthalate 4,5-cis-dihydrodiol dehydrogenase
MNLGIIGYGYTGRQHAKAIAAIEGVTLKCIAEPEKQKLASTPVQTVSDHRLLLEDERILAVTVCLPHHLHEEVASAALLAGKHVLVEKPLAMSVEAGESLCELAKTTKRTLMVEMTHRFLPPLVEAKKLIASGEIGEIMAVDEALVEDVGLFGSLPEWLLDRNRAGGGVGLTSGIHLIDHISWIAQQELTLQSATFRSGQELGNVEDTAAFALKAQNGAPVHILLCWRKQGAGLYGHLSIVGTRATLKIWPWGWIRVQSETGGHEKSFFPDQWTIAERALVGMRGALQEFVDAIRQNRFPDPLPEESLTSQALIEQAYRKFK